MVIFTHNILEKKIKRGGIYVPDFKDQLYYCILNNQINDNNYKLQNTDYRFIYDLLKIIKKVNKGEKLKKNKYYYNVLMNLN